MKKPTIEVTVTQVPCGTNGIKCPECIVYDTKINAIGAHLIRRHQQILGESANRILKVVQGKDMQAALQMLAFYVEDTDGHGHPDGLVAWLDEDDEDEDDLEPLAARVSSLNSNSN